MSAEAFKRQLEALSAEYRSSLPEKLEEIDALSRGLPGREAELLRALHSVAGSARTFGVKGVSEAAAAAELYLAPYCERKKTLDAAHREEFGRLLDALKLAASGGAFVTPLTKILLVEDDPDIRVIVKSALEMLGGYEVCACASGAEALSVVGKLSPQLALLDVMMPELDGPGVLARLRAAPATAALPVIFLTAKTAPQDVERLRALGAAGILTKPFDPLSLHEQVRKIWEQTAKE